MVEQRNHNPLVRGPNPFAATKISRVPGIFYFADFVSKFFKKGNLISLEGRVQTRSYDAQDGTKRYVTEVVVENVEFVGGKNDGNSSSSNSSR